MLTISVLICSYRRPEDLRRCLYALHYQTYMPEEVVVVARHHDHETLELLASFQGLPLHTIAVSVPGTVAARNAGLALVRSDLVAMADDDTAAAPDWLERVVQHFSADNRLGGLGGRDRCVNNTDCDSNRDACVGKIQYFGRFIGNHHSGYGAPRKVDILKGANMSFRTKALAGLRFDTRMRGIGAQPNEDLAFSLAVRRAGWRLLYDPAVVVDHYEAAREEPRHYGAMLPLGKSPAAFGDVTYNWVVAIWEEFSVFRRTVYLGWQALVGTRVSPGLLQAVRFTPALRAASWQRFWITQQAALSACRTLISAPAQLSRDAKRDTHPESEPVESAQLQSQTYC